MRFFARKYEANKRAAPAVPTPSGRLNSGHSREMNGMDHLQRMIGNQGVQGMLRDNDRTSRTMLTNATSTPYGYDFSRSPAHPAPPHPTPPAGIQPKLTVNAPGDKYEQEADRAADVVMRTPEPEIQRKPG